MKPLQWHHSDRLAYMIQTHIIAVLTDQWTVCSSHLFYTHDLLQGGHHGLLPNLHKCVNNANAENGHFMKDYSYLMGCLLRYINFGCPHLPRCTQAFSARSEQGSPLWGPGLSSGRLSLLQTQAPQLCHVGSAVPRHVGSSWTRYQTHVPCMGRGIPNHWTMREVLLCFLYSHLTDREGTLRGKATEVSSARLAVAQGLSSVFFWCRSPPTTR